MCSSMKTSKVSSVAGEDEHSGGLSGHVSQRPEMGTPVLLRSKTASFRPRTVPETEPALKAVAKHLFELVRLKDHTKTQRAFDLWFRKMTYNEIQVLAMLWTTTTIPTMKVSSVIPPRPLRLPQRPLRRLSLLL